MGVLVLVSPHRTAQKTVICVTLRGIFVVQEVMRYIRLIDCAAVMATTSCTAFQLLVKIHLAS